jgi:hypothetical protein
MKYLLIPTLVIVSFLGFACKVATWEEDVLDGAQVGCPIAATIFAAADPVAAPFAGSISGGCTAVVTALQDVVSNPNESNVATAAKIVSDLNTEAAQMLAAFQIKDPSTLQLDTKLAALFAAAIDDIANIIEQHQSTVVAALSIPSSAIQVVRTNKARGWKPSKYAKQYERLTGKKIVIPKVKKPKPSSWVNVGGN